MALSYKCYAKDVILKDLRNIRYANGEMLFGFNNTKELTLTLDVRVDHISLQADIFAREILTQRSKFDLKRILGQYQIDWLRLLHEAYVYDRLKCIYYGISSFNLLQFPENMYSFPGNIILMNLLSKKNFQYNTNDEHNYSLYVNIRYGELSEILEPMFKFYPKLRQGMSDNPNVVSYVNTTYETILKGLYNAKEYLSSRKMNNSNIKSSIYEITELNDSKLEQFTVGDSNPLINSFLGKEGCLFYFILPYNESRIDALRFNESVFLSRALGFCSEQLTEKGNNFYKVATRQRDCDIFARDEMYSVTGLKSEIVPYPQSQIREYLDIDSYMSEITKIKQDGGSNTTTP